MKKKILKWSGGVLLVALVLMQFFGPARTNPPVPPGEDLLAGTNVPPPVAAWLRAACYDCHSHETHWPWYGRVAPVSWWLIRHINEGREELNFSEWPHDQAKRARKKWANIADEVRSGRMPLPSYTWMHPAARLSADAREQLARWAEDEAARLKLMEAKEDN